MNSEDHGAAVFSSKINENPDLMKKHDQTQTLPNIDNEQSNALPSEAGSSCGEDCALDAGGVSTKSGPNKS